MAPNASPLLSLAEPTARRFRIPDTHRDRGIMLAAGSGSGKSMTLGLIAYQDFRRGVPQVLFDPVGAFTDAFLTRVGSLSGPRLECALERIRYVDMSGRGAAVPSWPLLFRYPDDSLQDVADRFLETCQAIDPHLQTASVMGYNALYKTGVHTGMLLAALGLQLDAAPALLDQPEAWHDRFEEALARDPNAQTAVSFFRHTYIPFSPAERQRLTDTYRAKVNLVLLDPRRRAMFCAPDPSIDFTDVIDRRQTVILDFRGETNATARLLKTRWVYDTLLAFIRHRGPGATVPLGIHIDEITELTSQTSGHEDLFSHDLDYLFNVLQRNHACWITAALQQLWQVSDRTKETLLSLGTHIYGVVSDADTAEDLSRRFSLLDPHRVKRWQPVWMSDPHRGPYIVDQTPVDMPLDEQIFLAAKLFRNLPPFTFLAKPRHSTALTPITLTRYMGDPWPSDYATTLAHIRAYLTRKLSNTESPVLHTTDPFAIMENTHDTPAEYDPDYWNTGPGP